MRKVSPALPIVLAAHFSLPAVAQTSDGSDSLNLFVGLESTSSLRTSEDHPTTGATVTINPYFKRTGQRFTGKVDVDARAFVTDTRKPLIEPKEIYLASGVHLFPEGHQMTLGRRIYDWSTADETWDLGLWSPQQRWDPLHPDTIGRTGLSYAYSIGAWRILMNYSPMVVPERHAPIREENGKLVSDSPFWKPPTEFLDISGNEIPIYYSIQYPEKKQAVFRSGGNVQLKWGRAQGAWTSFNYGYLPSKQALIAVEPRFGFTDRTVMNVTIHPILPYHHMTTLEAGYRGTVNSMPSAAWASLTREIPVTPEMPSSWHIAPVGPSWVFATGGSLEIVRGKLSLTGAYMASREKIDSSEESEFAPPALNRFRFANAAQSALAWRPTARHAHSVKVTQDIAEASTQISVEAMLLRRETRTSFFSAWTFGVGGDFFISKSGEGTIGQYVGDDRVRMKMVYAF